MVWPVLAPSTKLMFRLTCLLKMHIAYFNNPTSQNHAVGHHDSDCPSPLIAAVPPFSLTWQQQLGNRHRFIRWPRRTNETRFIGSDWLASNWPQIIEVIKLIWQVSIRLARLSPTHKSLGVYRRRMTGESHTSFTHAGQLLGCHGDAISSASVVKESLTTRDDEAPSSSCDQRATSRSK